ncbi:MAG: DUF1015 domain-containing protein, partial [Oscillospiraceae bacterium]|nr:DUF1015 domain-containing protein [Oscillospiraceae bacterium]
MAQIKPFRALRYTEKAGEIKTLVSPPYDIIPPSDYGKYTGASAYNVIRAEHPSAAYTENIYDNAAQFVKSAIAEGILAEDTDRSVYVYEIEYSGKRVKGFIPLVKLEEFSKGIILPHEETLSKAKADRFELMKATGANFSQIYSLYSDEGGTVSELLNKVSTRKPDIEFTDKDDNNNTHRLWAVTDTAVLTALETAFADKKLYIADGHHRYETAINYRNYLNELGTYAPKAAYIPMMLVALENEGLTVLPTHRICRNLKDYNWDWVIEHVKGDFEVTPYLNREKGEVGLAEAYKAGKTAFVYFTGNNNYTLLVLKDKGVMKKYLPDVSDALRGLDVSVLHTLILERLFGIDKANMAAGNNLSYT